MLPLIAPSLSKISPDLAMTSSNPSFDTSEQVCEIPEISRSNIPELSAIAELCQHSRVGKLLPNTLYVHVSALPALDPQLQRYESYARLAAPQLEAPVLVKFSTDIAFPELVRYT